MSEKINHGSSPDAERFTFSRTVDTPRDFVFQVWTDPDHLRKWWGPKGFTVREARVDLRPGGLFLYCLLAPDGSEMWGRFVYREIVEPERLVFVSSFSDPDGGVTIHPLNSNWPREMLSNITFEESKGKTAVTVEWAPINATKVEWEAFRAGMKSMQQGWTGTFEQLEKYLSQQTMDIQERR